MSKREAELKSLFRDEMKRRHPSYILLLQATNGAPDRIIAGNGRFTSWEMKHATPDYISHGDQVLMCMRLAVVAHCRYIFWWERCGAGQRTMIVLPKHVQDKTLMPESWCVGYDMKWLCAQVALAHGA